MRSKSVSKTFLPSPTPFLSQSFPWLYHGLQKLRSPYDQLLVVYYHRVVPQIGEHDAFSLQVTVERFRQHLDYLTSYYQVISLQELIRQIRAKHLARKRQVVITFDDGYRDNYLYAYPLLKQQHLPATIFVSTDYVEKQIPFFWEQLQSLIFEWQHDELELQFPETVRYALKSRHERYASLFAIHQKLKAYPPRKALELLARFTQNAISCPSDDLPLTWEQIREMVANQISIGAHTCSHPVLSTLPYAEAEQEIVRSKQILEEHLQQQITTFAYPYGERGDFTQETIDILKKHGFDCACSTCFGTNDIECNPFALKRVVIRNWDALTLARKIAHVFKTQEWILS